MSLLSFEPFFRDDIYACIYHFRIRLPKTCCISASYADLSPSKNFFSRHLSPDKTRKSHLDLLDGDNCVFERKPLETLAAKGELMSYIHEGFWQCMDNIREKTMLENLLKENKAPWKKWEREVPKE